MSSEPKDSLILQAAIEFGPDYTYTIKMSTMGPALYVHADSKESSRKVRKLLPFSWNNLYTIVLYPTGGSPVEDSLFMHYKPSASEGTA